MHGGTFTCHSVALAAAEKTLQILDETPALQTIAEYGTRLRAGMSQILSQRGIRHSFSGHPSMSGLFFSEQPPRNYRDWATSDYTFYEALAPQLHDLGVLCEPDSREPWFVCEAHDEALSPRDAPQLRGSGGPRREAAEPRTRPLRHVGSTFPWRHMTRSSLGRVTTA